MIFWPAVITLAITLVRLTGELLNWSPVLFNRAAGGGGALVGISWLPPLFGILFALQLARAGHGPRSGGRAIGMALLGVVAVVGIMAILGALKIIEQGKFSLLALILFTSAMALGAAIAWSGWPDLGRTLLAYAFAARIPVAIVMLVAMLANWGTHYDVAPPGFPEMGVLARWFLIGALPQLTTWIAFTILLGAVFGSVAGAVASRRVPSVARPAVA
jgi:hypothetical protein